MCIRVVICKGNKILFLIFDLTAIEVHAHVTLFFSPPMTQDAASQMAELSHMTFVVTLCEYTTHLNCALRIFTTTHMNCAARIFTTVKLLRLVDT